MMHVVYDPDRVLVPLKRIGGPGEFVEVGWEEALDEIASRIQAITGHHGADSLGLYFGNPAVFGFRHSSSAVNFIRRFGSSKIYNAAHVDNAAKMLACELVYGFGYPYTFPDLEACDFLLMLGANPLVSHMSLVSEPRIVQKLDAIAARGAVVVVDPRRTETARRFEHVAVPPDSDVWLLAGMLRVIFDGGRVNEPFLDLRVAGWRELRAALRRIDPSYAAAQCRLSVEDVRRLAERFSTARTAACYGRVGTSRGTYPTLTNILIEALNIVTGRLGQPGGWICGAPIFARARPEQSPASVVPAPMGYGSKRSRIGGFPLIQGFQPGGLLADDILTPGAGQLRALFVDSGNPVLAYPGGARLEEALRALDLLVGLDFYVNETTKHAHFILPTPTFLERPDLNDLLIENAPRPQVQYTDAMIAPLGQSRLELEIYNELLTRCGRRPLYDSGGGQISGSDALKKLMDQVLANFSHRQRLGTLSVARLQSEFPHGLLYIDRVDVSESWKRISHTDGKPRLWGEVVEQELARLDGPSPQGLPLLLFGRRKLRSLNSWMHNDLRIVRTDKPTLLMHPDDALTRHIANGQLVRLTSAEGCLDVEVELSTDVIQGAVSYPHGWGHAGGWRVANALSGTNVNELAPSDPGRWEQVSGTCLLDGIPVEVAALAHQTELEPVPIDAKPL
jgi:formate dehydrogenase